MTDADMKAKLLGEAVKKSTPLFIRYQDRERHVIPTLLGRTQDGRVVMHAHQFFAEPKPGKQDKPGWRFFYLDEIQRAGPLVGVEIPSLELAKGEYTPPAFIAEVLAIAGT